MGSHIYYVDGYERVPEIQKLVIRPGDLVLGGGREKGIGLPGERE